MAFWTSRQCRHERHIPTGNWTSHTVICILCPATHIGVGNHQKQGAKETALKRKTVWKEGQNSECPLFVILEDKKKKKDGEDSYLHLKAQHMTSISFPQADSTSTGFLDSAKPPHHKREKNDSSAACGRKIFMLEKFTSTPMPYSKNHIQ